MADYETIRFNVSGEGVAVVTLDRPDFRNALNAQVVAELTDVFDALEKNTEIRLLILRGAGADFSAGKDPVWVAAADDYAQSEHEDDAFATAEMLRRLRNLPQATLAVATGETSGVGCGLLCACDVTVALSSAMFHFPDVRAGLIPAVVAPVVIEAIGARWAKALFVTGETFDAAFGHQMGMIQYVAADEQELDGLLEAIAGQILAGSPSAIADAKRLVDDVAGQVVDGALSRHVARAAAARQVSPQAVEGRQARREARKPGWAG